MLHDKWDFLDMVNFKVMGWGDYLGRPNGIPKSFIIGRQEGQNQRRRHDNGSGSQSAAGTPAKEYGQSLEAGKSKEMDSISLKECGSADQFRTSDLQSYKLIKLYRFRFKFVVIYYSSNGK